MANRFQQRSGTTEPSNTDLLDKEFGIDTNSEKLYLRIGSSVYEVQLAVKNTATTTNPTVNDDQTAGYVALRSVWHNTTSDTLYLCTDASTGAAVWKEI